MTVLFLAALLIIVIICHKCFKQALPYVIGFGFVALGNMLPILQQAQRDIQYSGKAWVFGVLLVGLFFLLPKLRFAVGYVAALYALAAVGVLGQLHHAIYGPVGFYAKSDVQKLPCLGDIERSSAQVFQVTDKATGVSSLLMTGADHQGRPALCTSTLHYFPVLSAFSPTKKQGVDFGDQTVLEKYITDRASFGRYWRGVATVSGIPSVRKGSYAVPVVVVNNYLTIDQHALEAYGLEARRLA